MDMFVVLYKKPKDPTGSEQQDMLNALEHVEIVDLMPGSILVQGDETTIREIVSNFELWHVTPSQTLRM